MSDYFHKPTAIPGDGWIKVVNVRNGALIPCSGGDTKFRYDPPRKEKGIWVAGQWTPHEDPQICHNGYHVTRDPVAWSDAREVRAFWAEAKESGLDGSYHKTVFASIRLLRPVQIKDVDKSDLDAESKCRMLACVVPPSVLKVLIGRIFLQFIRKLTLKKLAVSRGYKSIKEVRKVCNRTVHRIINGETTDGLTADTDRLYRCTNKRSALDIPRMLLTGELRDALTRFARVANNDEVEETMYAKLYESVTGSISIELRNAYGYDLSYDKPIYRRKDGKFYPRGTR